MQNRGLNLSARWHSVVALGIFLLVLSGAGCASWTGSVPAAQESARPAHWARPIELEGVPGLHQVSKDLYRSAQPTAEGMERFREMGIRTVVNLRFFHSDRDEIGRTGLVSEHIPMNTWHPKEEQAVEFLRIVTDPDRTPVLVHCMHGADRTCTMVAIYRIALQGWTKEEALREMVEGGYGFHGVWVNLVPWIESLDIEKIKTEAGLVRSP